MVSLVPAPGVAAAAKAFLQHTGCCVSSRCADDVLRALGGGPPPAPPAAACEAQLTAHVAAAFGQPEHAVALAASGMSAFYAAFRAVRRVHDARAASGPPPAAGAGCAVHTRGRHRDLWLQLGWLYVDTMEVVDKLRAPPCAACDAADGLAPAAGPCGGWLGGTRPGVLVVPSGDLPALAAALGAWGHRVAGVVTEAPSNPLVSTGDLAATAELVHVSPPTRPPAPPPSSTHLPPGRW